MMGTQFMAHPALAALINGTLAHALDFDDVWADDDGVVAWRGHPSVCVLPASTLPSSSMTPTEWSSRSVRLVLPASTCARIPRFSVPGGKRHILRIGP